MIPDKETIRSIRQFTDITHPQQPNINLLLYSSFIHIKQLSLSFDITICIKLGVCISYYCAFKISIC
jgi:hypothetical protein